MDKDFLLELVQKKIENFARSELSEINHWDSEMEDGEVTEEDFEFISDELLPNLTIAVLYE